MNLDDVLKQRILGIEDMLARQKIDVKQEQSHLDEGSREGMYWHYGYMMACKDLVGMLGEQEPRH